MKHFLLWKCQFIEKEMFHRTFAKTLPCCFASWHAESPGFLHPLYLESWPACILLNICSRWWRAILQTLCWKVPPWDFVHAQTRLGMSKEHETGARKKGSYVVSECTSSLGAPVVPAAHLLIWRSAGTCCKVESPLALCTGTRKILLKQDIFPSLIRQNTFKPHRSLRACGAFYT